MSYSRQVLIAAAVAAGLALAWLVRDLLLLVFGGVLFAVVLTSLADLLRRWLPIGPRGSVAVAVLLLVVVCAVLGVWLGAEFASQLKDLSDQLPKAWAAAREWLGGTVLGPQLLDKWDELRESGVPWGRVAGAASITLSALGNLILMLLLAVFMAAEPDLYRHGLLRLLPVHQRQRVSAALSGCTHALRGWLKGQGLSMLLVGIATTTGLWLLDVPLPVLLGILAGLLDFVPFFGPVVSGAIAVLLAFTQGPEVALYVALLGLGIQQLEGNLVMPLVQRWAVQLPPALGVIAVVMVAGIFGVPGILFATPMVVVLVVLVRTLYVEDLLEGRDRAVFPQEDGRSAVDRKSGQSSKAV